MPNKHAAEKALRKTRKHTAKNVREKTHVKALTGQFLALVKEGKKAEAKALAAKLQKAIDKAARSHIFHPNKSARRVSAVHRALATIK